MPMRPTLALLAIATLLCEPRLAARAAAQDAVENVSDDAEVVSKEPDVPGRDSLAYNAELLDTLLTRSTEQTSREQKFAAAAGITGGLILVGLGTWRLVESEPQTQYSRGLGVMFMTLGMADLTTGIFAATRIPHEKRRLARWDKARRNGITALELGHFEGELQAAQETREGERLLARWNGLTHALAGVFVLALTPIPDSSRRSDRVSGYVIGGLFFALGMGTFATSFRATPSEKAWRDYEKRKIPMPGHQASWGITPSISRRGAGLSVGGTF